MDGSPSRGLLTSSFCPVSADEVMLLRSGGVFRGFSLTYFSPGETIPIRLFLGGFDLTPTFREVNKKYSTRYYLSLVLIDEGKLIILDTHIPEYKVEVIGESPLRVGVSTISPTKFPKRRLLKIYSNENPICLQMLVAIFSNQRSSWIRVRRAPYS